MFYTYILYSKCKDQFYIGQTNNLEDRLEKHNRGAVRSTARYKPWQLYSFKVFETRSDSMACERKLKNHKSRKRMQEFLERNQFNFPTDPNP
jgi:putative endonuclease